MPIKTTKKYANRKGAGKPKRVYKKRVYKKRASKSSNVADYAGVSVKRTLVAPSGSNFVINTLYSLMNTQLTDYQRAVQVAQAYQFYRIKKIQVTFKPTFDTFAIGGQSKMNMYWMLDKSGSIPTNVSLEGLKQMGARPFMLDEKNHTISWTPTVLESAMYTGPGIPNASSPAKYALSPWLSTNANVISPGVGAASGIDHLGLYWYCEQLTSSQAGTQYSVDVEVQFQFKKPLSTSITSSVSALPAKIAELNDSSDGIVGGVDGV